MVIPIVGATGFYWPLTFYSAEAGPLIAAVGAIAWTGVLQRSSRGNLRPASNPGIVLLVLVALLANIATTDFGSPGVLEANLYVTLVCLPICALCASDDVIVPPHLVLWLNAAFMMLALGFEQVEDSVNRISRGHISWIAAVASVYLAYERRLRRTQLAAVIALCTVTMIRSESLGPLLAAAVAVAVLLFKSRTRAASAAHEHARVWSLTVVGSAAALVLLNRFLSELHGARRDAIGANTALRRDALFAVLSDPPLVGYGLGNDNASTGPDALQSAGHAHNFIFEGLVIAGIAGLVCALLVLVLLVRGAIGLPPFESAIVAGTTTAFLFSGRMLYAPLLWLAVGLSTRRRR
ncbi:MAG: O-antigen ligase family protein [Actinomycetota bacterium]